MSRCKELIERFDKLQESAYTTYASKRKDSEGKFYTMRSYKDATWAKKNAFDIPSVNIFKQGDVYAQLSVLAYSDRDFTEVYFVSDKQGNEFGQYATKEGALKKAKEMAKLSLDDRKKYDESLSEDQTEDELIAKFKKANPDMSDEDAKKMVDNIKESNLDKNMVFNLLDKIEDKKKKMAHEIPEIKDNLKKWQDGKIKDSFFREFLNKYIDKMK